MASASIKRQRARRRIDQDGDPEFQVAPMVDVLLVLMLFFMAITSTEVLKKDKNLTLPEANHAKKDDKNTTKDQIVVNVDWIHGAPKYSIDGLNFATSDDVEAAVATRFKQNPRAYVLVRADQNVEYSSIADIMGACASAGVQSVSFAALLNPGNAAPSTADTASH